MLIFSGFTVDAAAQTSHAQSVTNSQIVAGMKKAAIFYRESVASHGGYVYHYTPDLSRRWGEGEATDDQVWVQPPGTPTVGLAYLEAYRATTDRYYLDAAQSAAEALVYGQVQSGGWTNSIDFNPRGNRVARYRNEKGRGRNTSSLDDGQTPSALLLLIRVDKALNFNHREIHEACLFGLNSLLMAQYPNGAFPQVWDDHQNPQPVAVPAGYPDYDWIHKGRIKEYWNMYTLNDNVPGYVVETLIAAYETYDDKRFLQSVRKLGDFLILAQMPEPQPGWAQQYNFEMKPIWARKFEPPGISADETQEVISTLLRIADFTGDSKYLKPVPEALNYLQRSLLADGRLSRYYELRTNKPLYMERNGRDYVLTFQDSNLPAHYGWKTTSRLKALRQAYDAKVHSDSPTPPGIASDSDARQIRLPDAVKRALSGLDDEGRWLSVSDGELLVGQLRLPKGTRYISSAEFSRNLALLSQYLMSDAATQ